MSEVDPVGHDNQNAMILGEMRGQLREVVHGLNNMSQKFDGLTREVVQLSALATIVGKLEAVVEALDIRIKTLETHQSKQTGSTDTLKTILASPLLPWLFFAAVMIYAALKGRIG